MRLLRVAENFPRRVGVAVMAVLAFSNGWAQDGPETTALSDRAALVALYNATGGPAWKDNSNWLTAAPLADWFGVAVDGRGRVQHLALGENGLRGQIPPTVASLGELRVLDLSRNELTGSIPAELGGLALLEDLLLAENGLSGAIPGELGRLRSLWWLDLRANALSGSIPPELGELEQLSWMTLSENLLSGPIPAALGKLSGLQSLSLNGNLLRGQVPAELGNLAELATLWLGDNDLEGALPVELANLGNLEHLRTDGNETCAPRDAAFQFWLANVSFVGVNCPPPDASIVDVAFAYTAAARTRLGGPRRVQAELDLLIAEANFAFSRSGVDLRLAHAASLEVDHPRFADSAVDLESLKDPSDGYFDEVHQVRDTVGADIVVLLVGSSDWVSDSKVCGRASQLTGAWLQESFASDAFAVMNADCGANTFVHELGHIMGVAHDRYEACSGAQCFAGAFPYGHGYVNQRAFDPGASWSARWRSVMAYDDQCRDAGFHCLELLQFSSPEREHQGDVMGVPGRHESNHVNGPADAVRTLNLTRELVSNFRPRRLRGTPVTVSFDAGPYSAAEGGDTAFVTVRISEAAVGDVAIPLTVALEQGASYDDFSGVPVHVVVPNGESTATFTVVAIDDEFDDDAERLVLGLGRLPYGASEGGRPTAPITLVDNDLTTQAISLPSGEQILLQKDGDGPWMLDGDHATNGIEVVREGRTFALELADDHWRLALYTVRTAAGQTSVRDGIEATLANLHHPSTAIVDSAGSLYIADTGHHRIRKVDPLGVISTVAGTGDWGFSGDGGPATAARLARPQGLALGSAGDLFLADSGNSRIRRIDALTQTIETIAGTGEFGWSDDVELALASAIANPTGLATDGAGGLYVSDPATGRIRRIDTENGTINNTAGSDNLENLENLGNLGDGGHATQAWLNWPTGIAFGVDGDLYVADTLNHRLRRIDAETGVIVTVAGGDRAGYTGDGGDARAATLFGPHGVTVDAEGNVFLADTWNHAIREINAVTGAIRTVAGTGDGGPGGDGEAATAAQLGAPEGVAVDAGGNVYVVDTGSHRVRRIDRNTGIITTVAGSERPNWDESQAEQARLLYPASLALDHAGDVVFVDSQQVWKLDSAGMIERLAGSGSYGDRGDGGAATEADFRNLQGIAVDMAGNVYLADSSNHRIRRIDGATGIIETIAGTGRAGGSGDGGAATGAELARPEGVAVDNAGYVYIADTGNRRVRRVDLTTWRIDTVSATSRDGNWADRGLASGTLLRDPIAVAVDNGGNLLIADRSGNRVLRVDVHSQVIETVLEAEHPQALAVDDSGNIFVGLEHRILRVGPSGDTITVAGTGRRGYAGDGQPAGAAEVTVSGIAVDRAGRVWFTDPPARRIRVLEPHNTGN